MRICDLASVTRWLPSHPTSSDPIWQKDIFTLTETAIQLFYARSGIAGQRTEAIKAIDTLQASVITATICGDLPRAPQAIVLHEPPEEPFFVDQLVDGLAKLAVSRRRACVFALESRDSPADVTTLTWKAVRERAQLPALCLEMLSMASQTRHLKLPYVFWEWATPQIATPLIDLQWDIEQAFDCTWPELVRRHARMLKIDRVAEASAAAAQVIHSAAVDRLH